MGDVVRGPRVERLVARVRDVLNAVVRRVEVRMTTEMHRIVRDVRTRMAGRPADEVYAELLRSLRVGLAGSFTPYDHDLRALAEVIEADRRPR